MQIKLISLTIAEHQDSLQNRDKQQLGNGLLHTLLLQSDLGVKLGGRRDSLNHVRRGGREGGEDVVILKPLGIPLGAPE